MTLTQPFPGHTAMATFEDLRRDLEGLILRDTTGKMRAGVLLDHLNPLVTGRGTDMKLNIADFRAVQNRGGAVLMANVGVDTSVTLVPPVANKRIDLIYATARSSNPPWSDGAGNNTPLFGFVPGIASATPVAPSLPANLSTAIPLATVEIPAGATSTLSAGVVITQVYPYTALAGGTVVARSAVELAAWLPADGAKAYCIADASEYLRVAGAWKKTSGGGLLGWHRAVGSGSAGTGATVNTLDLQNLELGTKVLVHQGPISLSGASAGVLQARVIYTTDGTDPTFVNGTIALNSRVYASPAGTVVTAPGGSFVIDVPASRRIKLLSATVDSWYRPDPVEMTALKC